MGLVVHIGACKTASTTLQKSLFSQHPNINYLGEHGSQYHVYEKEMLDLIYRDEAFWKFNNRESQLQDRIDNAKQKTTIISSEDISSSPVFSQCISRLGGFSSSVSFLLIVRNQISALQSYYAGHGAFLRPSPEPHYKRYVPQKSWFDYNFDVAPYGPVTSYDYWSVVDYINGLGKGHSVTVLLFEDFINNKELFCSRLGDLIGVPANEVESYLSDSHQRPRSTQRWHQYVKIRSNFLWKVDLGKWLPQFANSAISDFLKSGKKVNINFSAEDEERIHSYYARGNQKLADLYGLDLEKYSYPMQP